MVLVIPVIRLENIMFGWHFIFRLQIRRTDKLDGEAQNHTIEEYMEHVHEWYDMYEKRKPVIRRRVYIATDDPGVFKEASER